MALNCDQLLMNIETVQDIGSTIISDTVQLETHLQSSWQQPKAALNGEGEKDTPSNNLPACLQDDFKNYELHQKSELYELLHNRQHVGQLLINVSSLIDFQTQLSQLAGVDIYRTNTYYNSGIIPDYLRIPDDSNQNDSK